MFNPIIFLLLITCWFSVIGKSFKSQPLHRNRKLHIVTFYLIISIFTLSSSDSVALRAPSGLPNGKQYLEKNDNASSDNYNSFVSYYKIISWSINHFKDDIVFDQIHFDESLNCSRIGETRKNCFRYLKLMLPLNAAICTTISYTLWVEWYY